MFIGATTRREKPMRDSDLLRIIELEDYLEQVEESYRRDGLSKECYDHVVKETEYAIRTYLEGNN
jgi:hypothetical protein